MKSRIYLAAALLTALGTYPSVLNTGFSTAGIVYWMIVTLAGGAFWGFVGDWVRGRWNRAP